ncbi:VirB4 family type IV secretion system protein [Halobellus rubicundus]|uniref:VirB4 family type IV secretion system protein n=1 Tax=Halobellus rubicundus TaxID=2996466 RepID=A0ABD5M836_9EURY
MSGPSIRIPGDLNIPTRFFGRFTPRDLIRISTPLILIWIQVSGSPLNLSTAVLLLLGAGVSTVWYGFRPYGKPLDNHLYHFLRWLYRQQTESEQPEINIEQECIVVGEETVVGYVEVEPTNLEMKTTAEQKALHNVYENLLNTVSYPVTIHSRQKQVDLSQYRRKILDNADDSTLRNDYLRYIDQFSENELTATTHIITVKTHQNSVQWLQQRLPEWLPIETESEVDVENLAEELNNRINEVIDAVNTADLSPEHVTGRELEELAREERLEPFQPTPTKSTTPAERGGTHQHPVIVSELPSQTELAWPHQLLQVDGQVDITQVIHPRSPAKTSKKLQRISEKLHAEIDSLLRQGHTGTNKLESLLEDTEWFLDLLADREAQPVDYAAYITAHHDEQEKARQTLEQVINRLETLQIRYQQPVLRTDQAYHTHNLLYSDQLDETWLVPTSSAAAGFPFATQNTDQDHGVIYGVDKNSQSPVLLDRFQWSSHSTARMGMVGSGKSYASKIELLRTWLAYQDTQIIIVDPKKEYRSITRLLNGETQVLKQSQEINPSDHSVVNYTVEDRGQEENKKLLVDAVREIYRSTSQNRRKTLVLIDEARILLNDDEGRNVLNQFVLEARDTNTAITLVTQNASHFTHHRKGREILDNIPAKIFMRHDRVPDSVSNYFDLSQREKQRLHELKTGTDAEYSEALVKITGKLDTQIEIQATSKEHATITAGNGGRSR